MIEVQAGRAPEQRFWVFVVGDGKGKLKVFFPGYVWRIGCQDVDRQSLFKLRSAGKVVRQEARAGGCEGVGWARVAIRGRLDAT